MNISILSVGPPYRGGISEQTYYLYEKLSVENNVQLINFKRQYPSILFPGKNQYADNPTFQIDNNHRLVDSVNFFSWSKVANYIYQQSPDLILLRFWNPFFALSHGSIIKKIKKRNPKIKVIAICDNIIPHEKNIIDIPLIKYLFKQIDGFIVMSNKVEKELMSLNSEFNYKKIFHPVSNKEQKWTKESARTKLEISSKKIILFYGFVRKYKGLETLITSNKFLAKKIDDYQIIICGESYENSSKYEKLIKQYSVKENDIKWVNKYLSDEMSSLYFAASDVVVLPYNSASQSGVIPMAYSYERPVIASDIMGINEMVHNKKTGFLFKRKDPLDLSNKIIDFFQIEANYNADILEFRKQFSWNYFIDQITDLYSEL